MGTDKIQLNNHNDSKDFKKAKMTQGISKPLPKRLYTLPEAARYLGRTLWSMRELVWAGKLPIVRDGKRIFVDINDLELYVTKNKMMYV
jgi:excisionase family DNA binding protein